METTQMSLLAQCIADAKRRGLMGVIIVDQGGPRGKTAMCMDRDTNIVGPRAWDTHETPEQAIEDLARQMGLTPSDATYAADAATEA